MKNSNNFQHRSSIKAGLKKLIKKVIFSIPFVKNKIDSYETKIKNFSYDDGYVPGHYHSTIPDLKEIKINASRIFANKKLPGVDLNSDMQILLLNDLKIHYNSYLYNKIPSNEKLRYKKEGAWYRFSDCVFLHCMMLHFKPKNIIEIGSGHSSALMLDVNEQFFSNEIKFTFIEPFPEERLLKIMTAEDQFRNKIIRGKAQSSSEDAFTILNENDILFVDSTHVSKVGSDVNYLFLEIFPILNPGVLIHIHDIFYPFELPEHWVLDYKWFWNENYLLHAFLLNNKDFEIVSFNSYLLQRDPNWFLKEMPECMIGKEDTGSIWLRKIR